MMAEDNAAIAARVKRINEAVERVRGRSRSTDGTVYIETDARGSITDLRLSEYALEYGAERLAGLIVDRHRVAYAAAEAEAERAFTELSTDDDMSSFAPIRRRDNGRGDNGRGENGRGDNGRGERDRFGGDEYVL
ncbi:YbaB/EbfC family nucleoid-associated protein [Nocardia sp. NPDC005366]|uniref:YbaB/EbfC family nucleoid-associated protein n=1 Tax=Nocardia sp. NPDC005366 TaxID=3156878 RepID=UPI0033A6593F